MFSEDVTRLHQRVNALKHFQKKHYPQMTEENDNGEWEIGLRQWDEMNRAYLKIIENYAPESPDEALIDDMLYVIARDSECSHLFPALLQHPDWFEVLCRHSITTARYNARWQFAEQLENYDGKSEIKELLFRLIDSGDEYTERMALQSMCKHFPKQAEAYAIKFWNRNIYDQDEYQKIMALYALQKIRSPLLKEYIAKAHKTEYRYLKGWADRYASETQLPKGETFYSGQNPV